jgi:DNA processing protein
VAERAEHAPPAIRSLPRAHPDYPRALLDLSDPPATLHVRGRWPLSGAAVGIVGARAATAYGVGFAEGLAGDLARLGIVVVSGLAHGIDAAAHRGALAAGGATVAILPGGLDAIVPRGHQPLADAIATRGALMSEHEPEAEAYKSSFLARNRLIAALSRVVVVVEARERSGALNTAGHAGKLERPVLAVPGDVDRPTSRGCHALLRAGARVCESAGDVMALVESTPTTAAPQRVLAALATGPRSVEACAAACSLALDEAQRVLLELEWAGLARCEPGGRWSRRARS